MKMLNEQIDQLIKESMVAKTATRTRTLRAIKDQFLIHKTAKDTQPLDEVAELAILKRMVKQRNESATQYKLAGREDLYAVETTEAEIIKEFLPEEATKEELSIKMASICMDNGWTRTDEVEGIRCAIPKKEMGNVIKQIKIALPSANGVTLANLVKFNLEK